MAYDFHMAYDSVVGHHSPLYASAADTTTSNRKLNAVIKILSFGKQT